MQLAARAAPARAAARASARPACARAPVSRRSVARRIVRLLASSEAAAPPMPQAITLSDAALAHLKKMRGEVGGSELLLRVGVKQGGCSGMSYVMDFTSPDQITADDTVLNAGSGADAEGLRLVCDPKSLLYLFGMQLDYSTALIGGGFKFSNPNAVESCGCGTSFSV